MMMPRIQNFSMTLMGVLQETLSLGRGMGTRIVRYRRTPPCAVVTRRIMIKVGLVRKKMIGIGLVSTLKSIRTTPVAI